MCRASIRKHREWSDPQVLEVEGETWLGGGRELGVGVVPLTLLANW